MSWVYRVANPLLHAVHLGVIGFNLFGWMVPRWRVAHLACVALTFASWHLLGLWLGPGYCPFTEWHWRLKERLGPGRPSATFIQYWLQRVTRRAWEERLVDSMTAWGAVLSGAVSLALNLRDWLVPR